MISWPETSEVTPKNNERIIGGDMIRNADSERAWDKGGLNERSDDPPKLPSSECSLIDPMLSSCSTARCTRPTSVCVCGDRVDPKRPLLVMLIAELQFCLKSVSIRTAIKGRSPSRAKERTQSARIDPNEQSSGDRLLRLHPIHHRYSSRPS
jgi:hypothetical protein